MLDNITGLKRQYMWCIFASIILAFTPLLIVSFAIILYLLTQYLRLPFGLWGRLALSFLLTTCLVSCIAGITWLVHIELSAAILLNLCNVALLMFTWITPNTTLPQLKPIKQDALDRDDITAAIVVIVFAIILWMPLTGHPNAGTIGSTIMSGGDNGAHMVMVNTIDHDNGYAIGQHNAYNLKGILGAYPQGWHMNVVFAKWMVDPLVSLERPSTFLAFFYAITALWFVLLVFLSVRLALYVKQRVNMALKAKETFFSRALVGLCCAIGIAAWTISLFSMGFQSQIGALTLLLTEIIFVVYAYETNIVDERYRRLLLATLALIGSTFCWLFLLPIGGLVLGVCLVQTWWQTKRLPWSVILALVLAIPFILFQPAVQLFVTTPTYEDGIINQRGAVYETDISILFTLLIALSIYVLIFLKSKGLRILYLASVAALLFAYGIMQYQLSTVGELRYFFFKATYTYILFATILAAAASGTAIETLMESVKNAPKIKRGALVVLAFLLGCLLFQHWRSPRYDDFITRNMRGTSIQQSLAIADIVNKDPQQAFHITAMGSCNRGDDIRAVQLAYSLGFLRTTDNNMSFSAFELSFLSKEYLFNSIKEFVEREKFHLTVLSSDQVLSHDLKAALGDSMQYITLVELDATPETEPVTQCPDRIRTLTPEDKAKGTL